MIAIKVHIELEVLESCDFQGSRWLSWAAWWQSVLQMEVVVLSGTSEPTLMGKFV